MPADPGIGVGVGGMFASLFNPTLAGDVARHLTPNPNPLAQQGGPQDPRAVDSLGNAVPTQQPNLAPAAVTQPDPVNASYMADLMRYNRMGQLSDDLNRNIQGVAAGFGTAQQQQSKQAALGAGGGVGNALGSLAGIQDMQDKTIADNEHARFMGNAAIFAQTLSQSLGRPVSVQEATEIMNNKELMQQFGGAAAANATTTSTQKDAEAATRAWAAANPKATPQQIADYKANLIAGGMGGSDLGQRQYLAERSAALAAGQTFPDYPTWQAQHTAAAAAQTEQAKQAQEFKDSATQDYTAVHSKLTDIQQYIDTLNKDPAAAQAAMKTFLPTTGKWGALMPGAVVPDNVKAAAIALQKVQSALTGASLADVKNVRNVKEFNVLGQAATAGLDPAASPEDFQKAIVTLKNRYLDTQATAELAVGHKLTGELIGHGNRDLLQPTINGRPNPYYNGATEDNDFSKMSESDADSAVKALPSGSNFIGTDGQPHKKK